VVLDGSHRPTSNASDTVDPRQRHLRGDSRDHTHRSEDTNRPPPRGRHGDRPYAREAGQEQDLRDARRAQELQDRLRDAAEAHAAGAITLAQLTAINAAIKPKLEEAQTVAASPNRTKVLGDLVAAPDPATVWEASPDQRRAVVALLVEVNIMPTHHGPPFDPEAIKITWK
jgi:hypothetical protein